MITQALLDILSTILEFVWGLVPDSLEVPAWLTGAVEALLGWVDTAGSLGVWFPLDVAVAMALFIMHVSIGGFVVKAARILISHFTGGGGSAA